MTTGRGDISLYLILLLAFGLRVGAILVLGDPALDFSSDAKAYQDIAVNLVEKGRFVTAIDPPHTLDKPYANRPPLTPWVLAGVYEILGPSLLYGQLLLAVIGTIACLFVYQLGLAMFSRPVGLWAALMGAANPLWILFAAVPLTESLSIALYPLFALCSLHLLKQLSIRNGIVTGIVLGLTVLNKATILPAVPFWFLWLVASQKNDWLRAVRVGTLATALVLAVLLPWTIRNYSLFGRVIPVTIQAGHSMYEANNPYTDYALRRVEHGETWLNDPRYGEALTGLSTLEVEDKGRELALQYIKDNPGTFVINALRRARVFWMPYNHPAHRLYWYVVGSLFVIGFAVAWRLGLRSWRELFVPSLLIFQTMSLVILFPSMPRYRAPIEPYVLIFAGYAIAAIGSRINRQPLGQQPDVEQ